MKIICTCFTLFLYINCLYSQDFRLDNLEYKTISWEDFFKHLDKNPSTVFFDIRTPGERAENSENPSMNQGKIKGAIETDFFDFEAAYPVYLKHKEDTIYLYCSHSRRSRILAKQLADSSFKHVYSIDGGIFYLNSQKKDFFKSKENYYTTSLSYELLSPFDFVRTLKNKHYQLVDIRTDSIYKGLSESKWDNAMGQMSKVLHISEEKISENIDLFNKEKTIVLIDNDGEKASQTAIYLIEKGFKVAVLFMGIDNLNSYVPSNKRTFLKSNYEFIVYKELERLYAEKNTIIIDTRTESEFNQSDSVDWKNIGKIKTAINIPYGKLNKETFEKMNGKTIVLYDIMLHDEIFEYAQILKEYGIEYKILYGGVYGLIWEAYNTNNRKLKEMIEL